MNLEKICEALDAVDELGIGSINDECMLGQLFYAKGKTNNDINGERRPGWRCTNYFGGLLRREYEISWEDVVKIVTFNDHYSADETRKERHTRVLAHYEGLLIECLISQSSSPVEEESNHSEGVLIAR